MKVSPGSAFSPCNTHGHMASLIRELDHVHSARSAVMTYARETCNLPIIFSVTGSPWSGIGAFSIGCTTFSHHNSNTDQQIGDTPSSLTIAPFRANLPSCTTTPLTALSVHNHYADSPISHNALLTLLVYSSLCRRSRESSRTCVPK